MPITLTIKGEPPSPTVAVTKKATLKKYLTRVGVLAIDVVIIGGFLWNPANAIYLNFLTLLHFWFWGIAILSLIASAVFIFIGAIIEKFEDEIATAAADTPEKLRLVGKAFLAGKVDREKLYYKYHNYFHDPICLAFIGLIMGHWTLFIAYGIAWSSALLMASSLVEAYDILPASFKGEDIDGDGVPDDEAKAMEEATKGPIQKIIDNKNSEKEATAAAEAEKMENILDSITGVDQDPQDS